MCGNVYKEENMENKNWMVHVEFLVLLVTLIGGFYLLDGKIERQSGRTDQLYSVWCETTKQLSDYRKESDQKFYDLIKENRK